MSSKTTEEDADRRPAAASPGNDHYDLEHDRTTSNNQSETPSDTTAQSDNLHQTTCIDSSSNSSSLSNLLVPLRIPCVYYVPTVLDTHTAQLYYDQLLSSVQWEKTSKINRWVCLFEQHPNLGYRYRDAPDAATAAATTRDSSSSSSSSTSTSKPFPPLVTTIQNLVQKRYLALTGKSVTFTACLLNFYENGTQRIGWHSDREEIGRTTPIASVSLGATRTLLLRSRTDGLNDRAAVNMENGSVVFMENKCQVDYLHSVPKQPEVMGGRINLTFRCKEVGEHDTRGEEEHDARDRWLERVTGDGGDLGDGKGEQDERQHHGSMTTTDDGTGRDNALFGESIRVGRDTDADYTSQDVAYSVSCNIGTERQCAAEMMEVLNGIGDGGEGEGKEKEEEKKEKGQKCWEVVARPWGTAGYVAAVWKSEEGGCTAPPPCSDTEEEVITTRLLGLRSALNVMRHHDQFSLRDVALSSSSSKEGENYVEEENNDGEDDNDGRPPDVDGEEEEVVDLSIIDGEMLYVFYKKRLLQNPDLLPTLASASAEKQPVTFRVTTERIGDHANFRAPNVEYEMGGAAAEVYEPNVKPKMTDYDVNIRIDVVADRVMIGTQLNVDDLSKRHFLRYRNGVTIKTNLAYVMLRLAEVKTGNLIVDPFCGSGTILLEALEMTHGNLRCVGLDVSRQAAKGARENAAAEGYGPDRMAVHCADARGLRRHVMNDEDQDDPADAIVTNLPWGVRTGQNQTVADLQQMYETFLRCSWYILRDGGRIVMLVLRGLQLTRILRKLGGRYRIVGVLVVRTTNNLPSIVVVEKVGRDLLHESIKGQLSYMSQFVNVSKEMYHAINNETIDENN